MPLPNAKPDKRIYELLKNVDLENLTFADLQSVGQTIFAEQGAEDELRRLVLVNLARMSVAGEWTGLTSAGGGGGIDFVGPATSASPAVDSMNLHSDPIYGFTYPYSSGTGYLGSFDKAVYYPFYVPIDGTLASISTRVQVADTTGCDVEIGIYNSENGLPTTLIGKATIDCSATGTIVQTSLSATIALEANTLYYYGVNRTAGTSDGALRITANNGAFLNVGQNLTDNTNTSWRDSTTTTSLPTTASVGEDGSTKRVFAGLIYT